eukprot:IDg22097t1
MRVLKNARDEMVEGVANNRLQTALAREVPAAADIKIKLDRTLYSKVKNPSNKK